MPPRSRFPRPQVIENSARGAHDNVYATLERCSLSSYWLPTRDRTHLQAREAPTQFAQLTCDLRCKFTGWAENERTQLHASDINILKQSKPKGGSLAATGL